MRRRVSALRQIPPGIAIDSMREAIPTTGPMAVYVLPDPSTVPTTTSPELMPVRTEKVMGPKWVRGQQSLQTVDPPPHAPPPLRPAGSGK